MSIPVPISFEDRRYSSPSHKQSVIADGVDHRDRMNMPQIDRTKPLNDEVVLELYNRY